MTTMTAYHRAKPRIISKTPAGADHQVLSVAGGKGSHRTQPCEDCPWRVDATGEFPPEAFRISAKTAYDMSDRVFACHQSGPRKPATCAGFLLRGADHTLSVRLAVMRGDVNLRSVSDGGHELHHGYRTMAVANGVADDDPVLGPCRESNQELALRRERDHE